MRPLSNSGVSGELRYLGSPVAEDAPAERDHPAARVADREHQPAAEPVVAVLARFLGLDQHAGLDQLVVAEARSARPSACRALSGAKPMPNFATVAASIPRCVEIGAAPRRPRRPASCSANQRCAAAMTSCSPAERSARSRVARVGGGDLHPRLARQFLDRIHERQAARSVRKRIASPCAPQPKQW